MQLCTIATCPVTGSQGEQISRPHSTFPPQQAVESSEVTPQPISLQTRQTQIFQLLGICHRDRYPSGTDRPSLSRAEIPALRLDLWEENLCLRAVWLPCPGCSPIVQPDACASLALSLPRGWT